MLNLIFTIDYEIFGNGSGSLRELIYEPTEKIISIFQKFGYRYVNFVECAELIQIKKNNADNFILQVEQQIYKMFEDNFEIALHIHSQWFDSKYSNNVWTLNDEEYNFATLRKEKIEKYILKSINYLRSILPDKNYNPLAFRAGNWLFQPSTNISNVLHNYGIRIDSSVFKYGFQSKYNLDYRKAPKELFYWAFKEDLLIPDKNGILIEIPVYSVKKPIYELLNKFKKASYPKVGYNYYNRNTIDLKSKYYSLKDILRPMYPFKFDFTKMSFIELRKMLDELINISEGKSELIPIVLVGHTKNLPDYVEIEKFLGYIYEKGVTVSTFKDIIDQLV